MDPMVLLHGLSQHIRFNTNGTNKTNKKAVDSVGSIWKTLALPSYEEDSEEGGGKEIIIAVVSKESSVLPMVRASLEEVKDNEKGVERRTL
eukprot:2281445-Ditylum_brightwellii.AAC.1